MRIGVFGSGNSWYSADLQRAAGTRHQVVCLPFGRVRCELGGQGQPEFYAGESSLAPFDCLLVRSMPPGSLEQVVFRMDMLGRWEAAGRLVVNSPRAVEAAVDKYLCLAKMRVAGLAIPRTVVCQTVEHAMDSFLTLGADVVVKPLFGSEGRGIFRLSDEAAAVRAFKMLSQLGAVLYIQQFIPHEGSDLRLLVIGDQVLGMRRSNPNDWRTNISRGAAAEPLEVDRSLAEMARCAARAVGAQLAGVDLLPGRDGQLYAIEVNAVPGWRGLAEALKIDVAARVLSYLESLVG